MLEAQGDVGPSLQQIVEASQQSLHHQRREPRARQSAEPQELDDVGVTEGTHEPALLDKLTGGLLDLIFRYFGAVLEDIVDFLDGARRPWYLSLLHTAVSSRTDSSACRSHVLEVKRPQLGMIAKEVRHADSYEGSATAPSQSISAITK